MAIDVESRRSGPYIGTGKVTTYPFDFYMQNAIYVAVYVSTGSAAVDEKLDASLYTVTLNGNQSNNPGGVITLNEPLAEGVSLAITSEEPYTQLTVLTNKGGFHPEVINDALDLRVIQIQQLIEQVQRCVIVPITSAQTREELLQNLLDVAAKANEYAQKAEQILKETQALKQEIDDLEESTKEAINTKGEEEKAELDAVTTESIDKVTATGDAQIERIEAVGDWALMGLNAACQEGTFTATEAVEAGAELTLPSGMQYLPGRKHVRVAWNGIILAREKLWEDVGDADKFSTVIKLLMPLKVDDQINIFIAPLGSQDFASEIARITALEEALADLSRKVVYVEDTTTEDTTTE